MHRLDLVWKTGDYIAKVEPFNKHAQSTNVWVACEGVWMIECKRGRQHELYGLISVTMLCQFFFLCHTCCSIIIILSCFNII